MTMARSRSEQLPDITREYVLRVDFDLLDEEGCSWVSSRFMRGPRHPEPGEVVYLLDANGSGCVARRRLRLSHPAVERESLVVSRLVHDRRARGLEQPDELFDRECVRVGG